MNINKNAYTILQSPNFQQKKIASPSGFKTQKALAKKKIKRPKDRFNLDLMYDSEKLNETNLVSSNNITSRELSQKKNKSPVKHIDTGRPIRTNKNRQMLTNQTSLDPKFGHKKSPQFPKNKLHKKQSQKKIETIPFEISKALYRSQKSTSNFRKLSPSENLKTVKNLVKRIPDDKFLHDKRNSKRAKSRPLSKGSCNQNQRGSTKSTFNKDFKVVYNKHHRSFHKKNHKKINYRNANRKRALSSKEILLGPGLQKQININCMQKMGDLYAPIGQNEQMGLVYVDKSYAKKV